MTRRALTAAVIGLLPLAALAQKPPLPADEIPALFLHERPPLGLVETVPHPADARPSAARIALGRRLFFDPVLSSDRSVACASCHDPRHGFASPEALPLGVHGRRAARHAPTLLNRAFGRFMSWDGRAPSLEKQVLLPIENPLEMDLKLDEALRRIRKDAGYAAAFREAWGVQPDRSSLARSLSVFIRGLMVGDSPIDRFRAGDAAQLSTAARGGLWIFESKGNCWRCHSGANFTDEGFHNTGVGAKDGVPRPGRFAITGDPTDRGAFKTPTLRGLTFTAPYMHDGSLKSLEEVVAFYRRGGNANAQRDPLLKPVAMDARDARNLVAFLKALSPAAR